MKARFKMGEKNEYFVEVDRRRIPCRITGAKRRFMLEINYRRYGPFSSVEAAADIAAAIYSKSKEMTNGSK